MVLDFFHDRISFRASPVKSKGSLIWRTRSGIRLKIARSSLRSAEIPLDPFRNCVLQQCWSIVPIFLLPISTTNDPDFWNPAKALISKLTRLAKRTWSLDDSPHSARLTFPPRPSSPTLSRSGRSRRASRDTVARSVYARRALSVSRRVHLSLSPFSRRRCHKVTRSLGSAGFTRAGVRTYVRSIDRSVGRSQLPPTANIILLADRRSWFRLTRMIGYNHQDSLVDSRLSWFTMSGLSNHPLDPNADLRAPAFRKHTGATAAAIDRRRCCNAIPRSKEMTDDQTGSHCPGKWRAGTQRTPTTSQLRGVGYCGWLERGIATGIARRTSDTSSCRTDWLLLLAAESRVTTLARLFLEQLSLIRRALPDPSSLSFSFSLSLYVCIYLCIYLSIYIYIYSSLFLSPSRADRLNVRRATIARYWLARRRLFLAENVDCRARATARRIGR